VALIEAGDILNVGDKLRAINAEIKAGLQLAAGKPVPLEVATALNALQRQYEQARGLYTDVYRAAYGQVPTGLGAIALLGAPLAAWITLVAWLAVGGVLWQLSKALREAIQKWREGQAMAGQQSRIAVLQENIRQADAAGDAASAARYRDELARVAGQGPLPSDIGAWLQENILYVAVGVLGLVLVLGRR
jgi:hypothetical protein